MHKLYVGLMDNGKWYNKFEFKDIEGGLRKALNIKAPTLTLLMFKFIQSSISHLYDDEGNSIELTQDLYGRIAFIDGFAVGRAAQKHFTGEDYPEFYEYMRCDRCSKGSVSHYVEIKESWDKLIEKGFIEEIFAKSHSESEWTVELDEGLDISGQSYHKFHCHMATFDDILAITDNPEFETEIDFQNAMCDSEIYLIEGMDEKTLNMEKRKAGFGKFLSRYVKNDNQWDSIEKAKPKLGIIAEDRPVKCDQCRGVIRGYDLKNFFFFLTPTQNQNGQR